MTSNLVLEIGSIIRLIQRGSFAEAVSRLQAVQDTMAKRGHNPPLVVAHKNPPMNLKRRIETGSSRIKGLMSEEVHAILYRHADDSELYRHDFENPTLMLAVERAGQRDILITSPDGFPIWQDF
jgi:hypothetical protein